MGKIGQRKTFLTIDKQMSIQTTCLNSYVFNKDQGGYLIPLSYQHYVTNVTTGNDVSWTMRNPMQKLFRR